MTITNILLSIVVIVIFGVAIYQYIKKQKTADADNTLDVDDQTYTLEEMKNFVKITDKLKLPCHDDRARLYEKR